MSGVSLGYLKVQKALLTTCNGCQQAQLVCRRDQTPHGDNSEVHGGGGDATTAINTFWDNETRRKSAPPTSHSQK